MKKVILGLASLLISSFALANNCENARNTYDDVYCSDKIFASADADLNKNYQALRAQLDTNQKTVLKKSQLAWIRKRDSNCSSESAVYVRCSLEETQQRNAWLVERIRECNTVGCKSNRLRD